MMVDCTFYTERRSRCHDVYGRNKGEECIHEALTEKRCISMQQCPRQSLEYYGRFDAGVEARGDFLGKKELHSQESGEPVFRKALCASWAESFAYVDKGLEYGEELERHHQEARRIVSRDSKLRKECRQVAMKLAECLRTTTK